MSGEGVRLASLLMDLIDNPCEYHVDVLVDQELDLVSSWGVDVVHTHLSNVSMLLPRDVASGMMHLHRYGRILFAAKLGVFSPDRQAGVVGMVIDQLKLMQSQGKLTKAKVSVLFDDDPFLRCHYQPDADVVCGNVARTVRELAGLAHEFVVLTMSDRSNFRRQALRLGITVHIKVWPMQIRNMERLLPTERFPKLVQQEEVDVREFVAMMGNHHVVNSKMISILFESGAVRDICAEIGRRWSKVRLLFIGGVADLVQQYVDAIPGSTQCVETHPGSITENSFEKDVQPRIRAMLNPFFEDVDSGISVKTFEAIMGRVPVITSIYGLRGLADEMEACSHFPIPRDPSDTQQFTAFIINNVVDTAGYLNFSRRFEKSCDGCVDAQRSRYPASDVCPLVEPLPF